MNHVYCGFLSGDAKQGRVSISKEPAVTLIQGRWSQSALMRAWSTSPSSVSALLHHLREAVGDGQGGVDEPLHAAHKAGLRPVVQFGAGSVHTFVPADISERVDLRNSERRMKPAGRSSCSEKTC